MNKRKSAKLMVFIFFLNFISIMFALLIEKTFDLFVKTFDISLKMELLIFIAVIILCAGFFYIVYRQIYSLIAFEPIAKSIFSENQKESFLQLLKKVKNKEELTSYQKAKLKYFVSKSPLPEDFVDRYVNRIHFNTWEKFVLIIIGFLLIFSFNKKKNEPNRNIK